MSALHTHIGSPWQIGTKYAATLTTDVTGNLPANLIQWNTESPDVPDTILHPGHRHERLRHAQQSDHRDHDELTNAPQDSSGGTTVLTRLFYALPMDQSVAGSDYPTSLVSPGTAAGQLNVIGDRVSATIGPFP